MKIIKLNNKLPSIIPKRAEETTGSCKDAVSKNPSHWRAQRANSQLKGSRGEGKRRRKSFL